MWTKSPLDHSIVCWFGSRVLLCFVSSICMSQRGPGLLDAAPSGRLEILGDGFLLVKNKATNTHTKHKSHFPSSQVKLQCELPINSWWSYRSSFWGPFPGGGSLWSWQVAWGQYLVPSAALLVWVVRMGWQGRAACLLSAGERRRSRYWNPLCPSEDTCCSGNRSHSCNPGN